MTNADVSKKSMLKNRSTEKVDAIRQKKLITKTKRHIINTLLKQPLVSPESHNFNKIVKEIQGLSIESSVLQKPDNEDHLSSASDESGSS